MNQAVLDAKIQLVNEVSDKFTSSASAVVVEYRGLTVAEVTELRRELRKEGVDFKVYKNGVTRRAAEQAGYGDLNDQLVGPNAIAFSTDAVAPSRVLAKFAKKHDKLVLKGGVVEGSVLSATELNGFGELPSKNALVASVLGTFLAPISSLAFVLDQVRIQKEGGASAE